MGSRDLINNVAICLFATRAVRRPRGDCLAIRLHYDGNPEQAGRRLADNYQTSEEVQALIAGGDIRSLDAEPGEVDRISNGPPASVLPTHESLVDCVKNCGAAYLYIFDDGEWTQRKLWKYIHLS